MPVREVRKVLCDRCLESYPLKQVENIGDKWFCPGCFEMEVDINTDFDPEWDELE